MLLIGIHAPVLTVDHHLHEIGLGCRDVFPGDVKGKHRTEQGGIAIGVEKIQGVVAIDFLIFVNEIKAQVQGSLVAITHAERGVASKVNSHIRVGDAIDHDGRRYVYIGVVEGD